MSHILTISLSDSAFDALHHEAAAANKVPADVASAALELQFGQAIGSHDSVRPAEQSKQIARERFERHFGAVAVGQAGGAINESIDADLARAYSDRHEAV